MTTETVFRQPETDIIIPCHHAADTLERAVSSALRQSEARHIWLVDDGSRDHTWSVIQYLAAQSPRIRADRLPENGGVARARNWGALQSNADIIAFLDADDEYQDGALAAACFAFQHLPHLGLIRLRLQAVGLPQRYAEHPKLPEAWRTLQMTGAGNTVFRRRFFLACGGFPQDALFRTFGGEDGALGIATVQNSVVGTLFDDGEPAVLHHCREGMHAQRLLDAHLFDRHDPRITTEQMAQAEAVTAAIGAGLQELRRVLNAEQCGSTPLTVSRA